MGSLRDEAKAYEPKKTKNIADLEAVPVDMDMKEISGTNADGEEFSFNAIEVDGQDYRVPNPVLKDLKMHLEEKPDLQTFKVKKSGEGKQTKYVVIPLE